MPVEMTVDSVRVDTLSHSCFVLLKQPDQERYLPIAIGPAEATAIAVRLKPVDFPRPLTHDLLCTTIAALGGRVTRILIHDLTGGIFYARVVLAVNGRQSEVDSRPSDAIALAIRLDVPILVNESVLDQAGIVPEGTTQERPAAAEAPVSEEQLGAFRDVIARLNLDDLGGKPNPDPSGG